MRFALLFLVLLFTASVAYSQESVIEDTLDWRAYYPLEVDNAWEWETQNTLGRYHLGRRDIVADTVINERNYFVQVRRSVQVDFEIRYESTDTTFLRYDMPTSRIVAFVPETQEERLYECDLSADFGGHAFCGIQEMYVEGGYADDGPAYLLVGEDSVRFNAEKVFYDVGGWVTYYHGVGRLPSIGDGTLHGHIEYVYLKLSGVEYGQTVIMTDTEEHSRLAQDEITVFPNPVHSSLTIDRKGFPGEVNVTIFDLLGRAVLTRANCSWPQCRLNTADLPSGMYVIRFTNHDGRIAVEKFSVVR